MTEALVIMVAGMTVTVLFILALQLLLIVNKTVIDRLGLDVEEDVAPAKVTATAAPAVNQRALKRAVQAAISLHRDQT